MERFFAAVNMIQGDQSQQQGQGPLPAAGKMGSFHGKRFLSGRMMCDG